MKYAWLSLGLVMCGAVLTGGCARAARDTAGFAMEDSAVVEAPFEDAWQMTKAVLREQELEIYTRDKRGTFTAYTPMQRGILNPKPTRTEFSFVLEDLNNNTTQLHATTLDQVYGVTLLTYPGWHDRKTTDNSRTLAIIEAIQAKATGGFAPPVVEESAAAPEALVEPEPSEELGQPKKPRRWYHRMNPATWFDGKGKGGNSAGEDSEAPAMAPAEDPETPRSEAAAPQQAQEEPAGADAPEPDDTAAPRRWYHRLNPKNWF